MKRTETCIFTREIMHRIKEKENLYNMKLRVIANIGIEIMRDNDNPLWREFAEELTSIDKRLNELGVVNEDLTDYLVEIPNWIE